MEARVKWRSPCDFRNHSKFWRKTDCSLCHVGISNPKQLLEGASMPEAGRRRRAPPSQIQITFTPRAKDRFQRREGKETAAAPEGEDGRRWREAGSGEERALGGPGGRGRGARSPAELEGEKGGGRRAESEREARPGNSWARAQWPRRAAGRPLGSCYTAGAGGRQPRRRARAARRGGGHDYARGDPELCLPALSGGPARGEGAKYLRGRGWGCLSFPHVPSRPSRSQPSFPGSGARRPSAHSAAGPSRQLPRRFPPSPPHDSAHRTGPGPPEAGTSPSLSLGLPAPAKRMTLSAKKSLTSGGKAEFTDSPPPPPCE